LLKIVKKDNKENKEDLSLTEEDRLTISETLKQ